MARKPTRSSTRKTASRRTYQHSSRSSKPAKRITKKSRYLSSERKKDILGALLLILGVVSLLGLLGKTRGGITGWIVLVLGWIAGYGAILFPAMLILIGLWYLLRNEHRIPMVSAERLLGIIFLYINILTWIHFFSGGSEEIAQNGGGGGYLGFFFWVIFSSSSTLGEMGAIVVLITWLLIALAFTFDLSIPDLIRGITRKAANTGGAIVEKTADIRQTIAGSKEQKKQPAVVFDGTNAQPQGFMPIEKAGIGKRIGREVSNKQTSVSRSSESADKRPMLDAAQPIRNRLNWSLPDLEKILNPASKVIVQQSLDQEKARIIEDTLTSFGAPAHVVEIHRGPTFTQFGVEPDFLQTRNGRMRVRVNKIASLADDLALALAAQRIRVQAPVPGRKYVGIEVPNVDVELVSLIEGIKSKAYQRMNVSLKFVLGKDVAGKPAAVNLASMPHLLIAGTTGSGKSVCINAILSCLLLEHTPEELRFVLVDPKRVELTGYNALPHLLTPVVVEPEKVLGTLQWMTREMDIRYKRFAEVGARNIDDYNAHTADQLPYIVIIVDELSNLMMIAPEETERHLNRLAQMARATGIHVIIATQRPSVDVITGMIKANFPARISFTVASGVDSRVVLDQPGAERLIGRGDMLFQAPDAPAPVRLQGVFVANDEIQRLVDFWVNQAQNLIKEHPESIDSMPQKVYPGATLTQTPLFEPEQEIGEDELLEQAIAIVRKEERASISMLQRKLRIGYTRAARLIDRMEELEIISGADQGSGVRAVLDFGDEAQN